MITVISQLFSKCLFATCRSLCVYVFMCCTLHFVFFAFPMFSRLLHLMHSEVYTPCPEKKVPLNFLL